MIDMVDMGKMLLPVDEEEEEKYIEDLVKAHPQPLPPLGSCSINYDTY